MSLEKDFVPYQEALELKELGFDEPCFKCKVIGQEYFDYTPSDYDDFPEQKEKEVLIPTYSQAFRFFREKYVYDAHVRGTNFRASYVIGIPKEINIESVDGYPLVISWDYIIDETGERKIYEEAELACLRKLIEIVKTKK